jgi:WD40 repeat protein
MELWKSCRPINDMLAILRVYYYYSPVETDLIYTPRGSGLLQTGNVPPIKDIRQNMLQILSALATPSMTSSDFRILIGHSVSCKDPEQVQDLLMFLWLLTVSPESPLLVLGDCLYQFSTFHHLINNENEVIVAAVIELFAALHYLEFIEEPKVHHHVYILMDCGSPATLTSTFFRTALPLAIKYPAFLPMCFYTLERDKLEVLNWLTRELKPDPKFSEPKHWSLVPLLAGFRVGGKFLEFVLNFVAESAAGNWHVPLAELDCIGEAFGIPNQADDAKALFLKNVCEHMWRTPGLRTFELLHDYFDIAIFFIFFKKVGTINRGLLSAWVKSPFNIEGAHVREDHERVPINRNTLLDQMQIVGYPDFAYRYGIRLMTNGHWADYDLAMSLMQLALKTRSQTLHNLTALLLSVAVHEYPQVTAEQIETLFGMKVIDPPYTDLLNIKLGKNFKGHAILNTFEIFTRDVQGVVNHVWDGMKAQVRRLLHFREKSILQRDQIFERCDDGLQLEVIEHMKMVVARLASRRIQLTREWRIVYERLVDDFGPWNGVTDRDDSEKRKRILCNLGCPVRFERKKINRTAKQQHSGGFRLRRSATLPPIHKPYEGIRRAGSNGAVFDVPVPANSSLSRQLSTDEAKLEIQASLIKINHTIPCHFLVLDDAVALAFRAIHRKEFAFSQIKSILLKLIAHRPVAIQLTTLDQRTYLIQFTAYSALSVLNFIAVHSKGKLPKEAVIQRTPIGEFFDPELQSQWLKGRISNFLYLMRLNECSGRSFSDLSIYPVFPWVLSDYKSARLSLNDAKVFRDLSRPIGGGLNGYSNRRSVVNFLGAESPFADVLDWPPDFTSLSREYVLRRAELTPEFFISPKFFARIELPPWAHGDAYEFVYLHRKALESKYVTETLHQWIDLVFGVSQNRGRYDPRMFESIWDEHSLQDPLIRSEIEELKNTAGQIPVQLFRTEHPYRQVQTVTVGLNALVVFDSAKDRRPAFTAVQPTADLSGSEFTSVDKVTSTVYKVTVSFDGGAPKFSLRDYSVQLPGVAYAADATSLYSVGEDGLVYLYNLQKGELRQSAFGHAQGGSCIDCSAASQYVVTGGRDSVLRLYSTANLELYKVIPTLSERALCVGVSGQFSFCVCGTADKRLLLCDLLNGRTQHVIDLCQLTPKKLLVTKTWGFVLVLAQEGRKKQWVLLYSNNGELIKQKKLDVALKAWTTFKSSDGFDYVVAADHDGGLHVIEAFFLDFGRPVYEMKKTISAVFYSIRARAILAVGDDGTISLVPADFQR